MLDQAVSMSKKSPEAFRTISEVSVELDVPQHVLRFWETRFAQVRPVKRGGGRRYYRPEDVDVLRGIRSLLYSEGFTIKGVQKIFRDHGVRYVAEIGRGEASIGPADIPETLPEPLPSPSRPSAEIVSFQPRVIVSTTPELSEDNRVKLEILLAALLQMKGRIRAAMSALTV